MPLVIDFFKQYQADFSRGLGLAHLGLSISIAIPPLMGTLPRPPKLAWQNF
jgi:hypothetical protein